MFRQLIGSDAGSPGSFSVPFPGGEVSLSKPKQLFVLSPSHVAVPSYRSTTAAIDRMIPFIAPTPVTFPVQTFTRASIATVVNSQRLIELVQANTPHFVHDPVTLAPKGLLLEAEGRNIMTFSNNFSVWSRNGTSVTPPSTDFPIFANIGNVWLLQANGTSGSKHVNRAFTASSAIRTASAYLRRGTNIFAQLFVFIVDEYANFNLETSQVGSSAGVISSTITPCAMYGPGAR